MATHKSAEKRIKTSEKERRANRRVKSLIRGAVKDFTSEKDGASKAEKFKNVSSMLDKAAGKNVIHKNKAARTKSRLSKTIKK